MLDPLALAIGVGGALLALLLALFHTRAYVKASTQVPALEARVAVAESAARVAGEHAAAALERADDAAKFAAERAERAASYYAAQEKPKRKRKGEPEELPPEEELPPPEEEEPGVIDMPGIGRTRPGETLPERIAREAREEARRRRSG